MASYKVLKSVAHSLAHSFTSALNWGDGDYVMGNLLLRAREVGANTLEIDLVSGAVQPAVLLTPSVQRSVDKYTDWLRRLVANHRSDMRNVLKARLTIRYNLAIERPNQMDSTGLESPYECTAEITDDRGKTWSATLRDWWAPVIDEQGHIFQRFFFLDEIDVATAARALAALPNLNLDGYYKWLADNWKSGNAWAKLTALLDELEKLGIKPPPAA